MHFGNNANNTNESQANAGAPKVDESMVGLPNSKGEPIKKDDPAPAPVIQPTEVSRLTDAGETNDVIIHQQVADRTAEEVGIDMAKMDAQPANQIIAEAAALHAANSGMNHSDDEEGEATEIYSSHPVQQLHIGPYHFVDSVLKLTRKEAEGFDKVLKSLPAAERMNVKKLDVNRVNAIVESRRAIAGQMDSSAGRAAMENLRTASPIIGTQAIENLDQPALGFSAIAGNQPVVVETAAKEDGAQG